MSKGMGSAQRKIIEATGCTCSLWDYVERLPLMVAHDSPKEFGGIKLNRGTTWRVGGQPYYWARTTIESKDEYFQLLSEYRAVTIEGRDIKLDDAWKGKCAFTMRAIYEAFDPDIWGDRREYRRNSKGYDVPMNPPEINVARNRIKATVSRALKKPNAAGWLQYLKYEHGEPWQGNVYAFMVPPSVIVESYSRQVMRSHRGT